VLRLGSGAGIPDFEEFDCATDSNTIKAAKVNEMMNLMRISIRQALHFSSLTIPWVPHPCGEAAFVFWLLRKGGIQFCGRNRARRGLEYLEE